MSGQVPKLTAGAKSVWCRLRQLSGISYCGFWRCWRGQTGIRLFGWLLEAPPSQASAAAYDAKTSWISVSNTWLKFVHKIYELQLTIVTITTILAT